MSASLCRIPVYGQLRGHEPGCSSSGDFKCKIKIVSHPQMIFLLLFSFFFFSFVTSSDVFYILRWFFSLFLCVCYILKCYFFLSRFFFPLHRWFFTFFFTSSCDFFLFYILLWFFLFYTSTCDFLNLFSDTHRAFDIIW